MILFQEGGLQLNVIRRVEKEKFTLRSVVIKLEMFSMVAHQIPTRQINCSKVEIHYERTVSI
jgi:hypothetical protein